MKSRDAAIKIVERLRRKHHEALLAGGCVRDMLLERPAKDFDVATDATPEQVKQIFKRTLEVGAKFGVVIVFMDSHQIEVATFRTESGYTDGRHPTQVEFAHAAEDAKRRDFTVNGMFYDPIEDKVIDYVDGRSDLDTRTIRTIGDPEERFGEDYLRMLRAVRFSTQLRFRIEPATWAAIKKHAEKITGISAERIAMELEATLVDPNRGAGAAMLIKSGLAENIFPCFVGKEAKFAIKVLSELRQKTDFPLVLAAFFAGFPTKFALEKCQSLRLSKNHYKHLKFLLGNRGKLLEAEMPIAELKMLAAEPYFWGLYELQRATQKASPAKAGGIAPLVALRRRIRGWGDEDLRPAPLLDGHDLMRLGAVPGPALGQLAEEMYIAQLEGELKTPQEAKAWVRCWLQKHKDAEA